MEQHTSRRDWLLAASIIAGSAVRLYQLSEQIIADDEWHALHAARDLEFFSIASHFGGADVSIPIALFYRLVITTFGLSEWIMRAPVLLFGLLTLVAFPLLVGKLFDRPRAALFGWLLAISPLHIYYSRYARPYSIALFCALSGVLAFYLWRTTAARRWRYVYAVCAIVGPYFHLSVLLVVGVPIALMVLSALFKQSRAREFPNRELLQVVVFVGIGLAVLLLPPIYGDFATLADKARHGTLTREALVGAIGLLLGIESHSVQAFRNERRGRDPDNIYRATRRHRVSHRDGAVRVVSASRSASFTGGRAVHHRRLADTGPACRRHHGNGVDCRAVRGRTTSGDLLQAEQLHESRRVSVLSVSKAASQSLHPRS